MGRKRKKATEKLPKYVYLLNGRYVLRVFDAGKFVEDIRLCDSSASLAEVWAAYESVNGELVNTLNWLMTQYILSPQFRSMKMRTVREMMRQKEVICNLMMKSGRKFGDLPLSEITPGMIRKYLDKRGQEAPVMANREVSLISMAWNWGRERDKCGDNPTNGVRRNPEKPRDRYVTDAEYQFVYDLSLKVQQPWLPIAMELAFLCRARLGEILNLKEHHITEEGLLLERSKKSKTQIILYGPRLNAALEAAKNLPGISFQRYIIHDKNGQRIKEHTFKSAWQRLMIKAVRKGLKERFTFHDLKAKGVSDFDGDKKMASGHRTNKMVEVYDRKPEKVKPTR